MLGWRRRSIGRLARLAAGDFAAVPPDSLWTATVCLAAEVAARLDDRATARAVARLAAESSGGPQ